MDFGEHIVGGKPPVAQYYSTTVVDKDIVTFGGWDEKEQQFDVYILDTGIVYLLSHSLTLSLSLSHTLSF
jgi:hypothetical protein